MLEEDGAERRAEQSNIGSRKKKKKKKGKKGKGIYNVMLFGWVTQ